MRRCEHPLQFSCLDAVELDDSGLWSCPIVLGGQGLQIKETRILNPHKYNFIKKNFSYLKSKKDFFFTSEAQVH